MSEQNKTILDYETVALDDADNALVIIDQALAFIFWQNRLIPRTMTPSWNSFARQKTTWILPGPPQSTFPGR